MLRAETPPLSPPLSVIAFFHCWWRVKVRRSGRVLPVLPPPHLTTGQLRSASSCPALPCPGPPRIL